MSDAIDCRSRAHVTLPHAYPRSYEVALPTFPVGVLRPMGVFDRSADHRDIVTIGASAGGIAALQQLVRQLPPDFPAAVLVVQHVALGSSSLPAMIGRGAALAVEWAEHGDELAYGRVLIAPPGTHLLID